ncbi:MAG TPA: HutD family protein [Rhodanobacteraceae bacterium]|nr:HutD family protein [Rhodanobacteraceae bacterium]
MTKLTRLRATDYQRVRWKNDGGWTTEIARDPEDPAADFRWRISIAEIESDGPFSEFPGVARELMLLAGNGIELDIDDAPPLRLTERFQRVRFEGESRVDCRLVAGPTRDFNVMTRRGAVRSESIARPLVGPMVLFPEAGAVWLVHVFSGSAEAQADGAQTPLDAADTLRIDFETRDAGRVVIDGGGEVVLVKLMPAG